MLVASPRQRTTLFRHYGYAIARRPRHAGETVKRGWAVNQHNVVVILNGGQYLLQTPNLPLREAGGVKGHCGGRPQENVDCSLVASGPATGNNGVPHLGGAWRGEKVGNVEMAADNDI